MELISDILLIAGAVGAAFYCFVLSRRLSQFTNLDKGVGGAIAVLSAQVDDMTRALANAQGTASGSTDTLATLTTRAEEVAGRLELLVASMHDLPEVATPPRKASDEPSPRPQPPSRANPSQRAGSDDTTPDALGQFRSHRNWVQEAAE